MSRDVDTMVTVTNFTRVLVLRHKTRASDVCVKTPGYSVRCRTRSWVYFFVSIQSTTSIFIPLFHLITVATVFARQESNKKDNLPYIFNTSQRHAFSGVFG